MSNFRDRTRSHRSVESEVEQLTAGEKLPQWDRVFYGAEGEKILEKVKSESRAYIRADRRQSVLRAFGDPSAVKHAKT